MRRLGARAGRERSRVEPIEHVARRVGEQPRESLGDPVGVARGLAPRPQPGERIPAMLDRVGDDRRPERRVLGLGPVAAAASVVRDREVAQQRRCDEMQGYLFSPPVPASEVLKFFHPIARAAAAR